MARHDIDQRSPQWLMARLGYFTASRAADLLAYDAKGKPKQARADYIAEIACERLTGMHLEHYVSPAMQRGIDLEAEAADAYEALTGVILEPGGWWTREDCLAGASPDRIAPEAPEFPARLVEIKCPANQTKHLKALASGAHADEYRLQVQWQLWVCGYRLADVVSYDPRFPGDLRLAAKTVEADPRMAELFAAEVSKAEDEVREIIAQLRLRTTGA